MSLMGTLPPYSLGSTLLSMDFCMSALLLCTYKFHTINLCPHKIFFRCLLEFCFLIFRSTGRGKSQKRWWQFQAGWWNGFLWDAWVLISIFRIFELAQNKYNLWTDYTWMQFIKERMSEKDHMLRWLMVSPSSSFTCTNPRTWLSSSSINTSTTTLCSLASWIELYFIASKHSVEI